MKEIHLTPQELEDLEDDIKFRTKVIMQLKALNGIPKKVTELSVHSSIQWTLIVLMLAGVLSLGWRVLVH